MKLPDAFHRAEERFLGKLLGISGSSAHAKQHVVNPVLVLCDQQGERLHVSLANSLHQRQVVEGDWLGLVAVASGASIATATARATSSAATN